MKKSLTEKQFAWIIISPAILIVFGIVLYPLVQTFLYSLKDMNQISANKGDFVGLANYINILSEVTFWQNLGRTVYFSVVSISLEVILGVAIALLLNENFFGRKLLAAIVVIPWAIPNIVSSTLWKWIYHPEYGALNALLTQFNIIESYQSWLGTPWLAMNMIILADVWKMTPLAVIFFLSALQLTNKSIYEAAVMDGAGLVRRFFHITLSYLKPMLLVIIVMRTMETFKVFDLIYVMTKGGPANGTMVLGYQAYAKVFENLNYSDGASYSYLIAILIAILTITYIKVLKRGGE